MARGGACRHRDGIHGASQACGRAADGWKGSKSGRGGKNFLWRLIANHGGDTGGRGRKWRHRGDKEKEKKEKGDDKSSEKERRQRQNEIILNSKGLSYYRALLPWQTRRTEDKDQPERWKQKMERRREVGKCKRKYKTDMGVKWWGRWTGDLQSADRSTWTYNDSAFNMETAARRTWTVPAAQTKLQTERSFKNWAAAPVFKTLSLNQVSVSPPALERLCWSQINLIYS